MILVGSDQRDLTVALTASDCERKTKMKTVLQSSLRHTLPVVFCALLALACYRLGEDNAPTDSGADSDTDVDSDSDTDSDSDGDSDSDSDADTDTERLIVDPADQVCGEPGTCDVVQLTCDQDEYAAVSAFIDEDYIEDLEDLCNGIPPEKPLFTPVTDCIQNQCVFTGIAPFNSEASSCNKASDCIWATTRCDSCECYEVAINQQYQPEARALFENVCEEWSGGVCDIDCDLAPVFECLDGQCSWPE